MKLKIFIIKIVESLLYFFYRFSIKKKIDYDKEFKKIALIMTNPLGIGDLIMSTPYIKTMRKNFPNSEIHLITDKDIFEVEYVEELDYIHIVKGDLISLKNDFKLLSKENFDLGVIMNRAVNQVFYLNALNPRFKLGYLGGYSIQSNFKLKVNGLTFKKEEHFSKMSLNVADSLNLKIDCSLIHPNYSCEFIKITKKKLNLLSLRKNLPIIGLNTNVQWESRRWDEKNYINLVKKLHKKYNFILLGAPGKDSDLNRKIEYTLQKEGIFICSLSGKLNLKESIVMMKHLDLLVTADSGPMHFAFMMKTPVIALFGPINPSYRLPLRKEKIYIESLWLNDYVKINSKYNYESELIDSNINGLKAIPIEDVEIKILKFFKR